MPTAWRWKRAWPFGASMRHLKKGILFLIRRKPMWASTPTVPPPSMKSWWEKPSALSAIRSPLQPKAASIGATIIRSSRTPPQPPFAARWKTASKEWGWRRSTSIISTGRTLRWSRTCLHGARREAGFPARSRGSESGIGQSPERACAFLDGLIPAERFRPTPRLWWCRAPARTRWRAGPR